MRCASFASLGFLSLVLAVVGCDDPLSPREVTARRLDALAERVDSFPSPRSELLHAAAHTLRRGAAINTITVSIGDTPVTFSAVLIETGFVEDTSFSRTTVIGWSGKDAESLLFLQMAGSSFLFPDTTTPYPDGLFDRLELEEDTTISWYQRSGAGHMDNLSEGATCKALSTTHTCQAIRAGLDLTVKMRRYTYNAYVEPVVEQMIVLPRSTLNGIRYLTSCPLVNTGNSYFCWMSLVDERASEPSANQRGAGITLDASSASWSALVTPDHRSSLSAHRR